MSQITQEQIDFLLKHCFLYKAKEGASDLSEYLFDDRAKGILEQVKQLGQYSDYNKALNTLKKEYFDKYYVYENMTNEVVKKYLIEGLYEFERFGWTYRDCPGWVNGMWGPSFDGKNMNMFSWRKDSGKDLWQWFPYQLSETLLYNEGHDKSRDALEEVGFKPEYGSTVASYIERNMVYFKPYALAAAEYLKTK